MGCFMRKLLRNGVVIIFITLVYSICLAAQPPEKFLNYNLRSVYSGMGEGGTQRLRVTLKDFVNLGLKKGSWEKVSDTQWIYRIKGQDPVTKRVDNTALVFSRVEGNRELQDFFKDDVILSRVVINNQEMSAAEIFAFSWQIASTIYSMTEKGKEEIKKQEEQKRQYEAERKKEEEIRKQKEEEERKKAEEEKQRKQDEEMRAKELKKQERLKSIPGHYENLQGSKKYGDVEKYGEIDIQLLSENSIMFSGYNQGGGRFCKFENKTARLEKYNDYRDVYIAIFEEINDKMDKDAPNNCRIEMEFGKYSEDISAVRGTEYFLSIAYRKGLCRAYCERGGEIMGRYDKIGQTTLSNQEQTELKTQSPEQSQNHENGKSEKKGLDGAIKVFKGIFGGK